MTRLRRVAALSATMLTITGVATSAAAAHEARAGSARADAQRFGARTTAQLDRALASAMARTWAPGVIAGVWMDGRGWTAVRGVADRSTGGRPAVDGHTRIGSVTKTFTGTLILQLVDEGRLSLDDTIERWFPALPDANSITVRQLGEMSSGIASYTADPPVVARYLAEPQTVWSPDELIAAGTSMPRAFPPGQGFLYSNTNFLMLGQIVEQLTGQPLAEVMRTKLFAPLGMRHTRYPSTSALPTPSWHGYTLQGADGEARDATSWSPTFASAAGQIVSTLGDLRRWTRALGTGSLLQPATQRARLQANPASAAGGRAYAFAIGTDHGWILHSGELPGYNTQVAYLPSRKATIVVLTNADIPGADGNPAPAIFQALAGVVAPGNRPAG